MPRVTAIEIVKDRTATARCDEGFLRLKRYVAVNRREDGSPQAGDGSPLEEGAFLRWRELGAAIRACESAEIEDAKTEIAFRRLAARLGR